MELTTDPDDLDNLLVPSRRGAGGLDSAGSRHPAEDQTANRKLRQISRIVAFIRNASANPARRRGRRRAMGRSRSPRADRRRGARGVHRAWDPTLERDVALN